jgi:Cd(II)/Pb(II)-responsive transcriptional regulator
VIAWQPSFAHQGPCSYSRVKFTRERARKMREGFRIGALAERAQCQPETIRYYEREGLLPSPPRSGGNYRVYGVAHLERLSFIRHCRSLDMTLDEVRTLLNFRDAPTSDCGEVGAVLEEHIHHVVERISQLRRLEQDLKALRALCPTPGRADGCGILKGIALTASHRNRKKLAGHLAGAHVRGSK